jgi:hypothetical protein
MGTTRRLGLLPALVLAWSAVAAAPPATSAVVFAYDLQLPIGLAVSGTVTDDDGDPVAAASVGICLAPDDCFHRSTQTAADGTWTIRGVDPGIYYVVALAPEGENLLRVAIGGQAGGTTDPALAEPVEVTTDVTGLALAMPSGLRITGTVRSPEGDPVPGVNLHPSCDTNGGSAIASGADGSYQAVGLPPSSTCQLQVEPPGGSDFPRGYASGGTVQADYGGTEYQVADADLTGQDITLIRGRTISGHLTGTSGGVSVSAIGDRGSDEFRVEAGGSFAVRALWPGTYWLIFAVTQVGPFDSQFPYGLYDGDGVPLAPQDAPGVTVDVTAGNVTGLAPVLPVLPSISGTVRDAGGPVAGAIVTFNNDQLGAGAVTTTADGTYRALNLPPAGFVISAGAGRHVQAYVTAGGSTIHEASATPVVVADKDVNGVDLLLPLGGSLGGVITGPDGEPVVGAHVSAAPVSGGISMLGPGGDETDASGAYQLGGLAAGDYRLHVTPAENSAYVAGYWSTTGFTPDFASATLVHVAGDVTAPTAAAPKVGYTAGAQLARSTGPVHVGWTGSDAGSGIDHYAVQQSTNGGAWMTVAAPRTPSLERNLAPSSAATHRFRVRAFDKAGNVSAWAYGPTFRTLRIQQSSSAVAYRGRWSTATSSSASGGTHRWTRSRSASASFTFSGRAVGWVAVKAPGYGKAKVYIDGAYAATVNLAATSASHRRIVFSRAWTSTGTHTIRIICQATSGHPKVAVDAFVVLR